MDAPALDAASGLLNQYALRFTWFDLGHVSSATARSLLATWVPVNPAGPDRVSLLDHVALMATLSVLPDVNVGHAALKWALANHPCIVTAQTARQALDQLCEFIAALERANHKIHRQTAH